jgi:hypothetical protein
MRSTAIVVCSFLMLSADVLLVSQGPPPDPLPLPRQTISLPTLTSTATVAGTNYTYTLLGGDPAKGGTTTIPTLLVAITLTIAAPMDADGRKAVLDAGPIARQEIRSPIFADYPFASGTTQYGDALMRTDFHAKFCVLWRIRHVSRVPESSPLSATNAVEILAVVSGRDIVLMCSNPLISRSGTSGTSAA